MDLIRNEVWCRIFYQPIRSFMVVLWANLTETCMHVKIEAERFADFRERYMVIFRD